MANPGGEIDRHRQIAVVLDHDGVSKYAAQVIAAIAERTDATLTAVLTAAPPRRGRWLDRLENGNLRRYATHGDHARRAEFPGLPTRGLDSNRIGRRQAAWLADQGIDLVVNASLVNLTGVDPGPLAVGLLTWRLGAGCRPGRREVALADPATTVRIEFHPGAGGPSSLIFEGDYTTKWFGLFNEASIATFGLPHLLRGLDRILADKSGSTVLARHQRPRSTSTAGYLRRVMGRAATDIRHRLSNRRPRWSVHVFEGSWSELETASIRSLPNPPDGFLADPFIVERDGAIWCFVEEWSDITAKATISSYRIDGEPRRVGTALEEAFHLSFPFLFDFAGELYMCPETMGGNDIRLYRCTDFPLGWEPAATLLNGVAAADTVIFEHAERWWMLTTIDPSGTQDPTSELHVFFSDTPLGGWQSHPGNPVRTDLSARNGGFLPPDERGPLRVAQRQGFDQYGAGWVIRRIVRLTTTDYAEEDVAENPALPAGVLGTHHLHSLDRQVEGRSRGLTVIDQTALVRAGKRRAMRPSRSVHSADTH